MSENNIMRIYWWNEDDVIHYRCAGQGQTYMYFYKEWVPKSSYRCTSSDFPWDFFVFDDSNDHQRLIEDFGTDIVIED